MVGEFVLFLFMSCEESQTNERGSREWVSDSSRQQLNMESGTRKRNTESVKEGSKRSIWKKK